MPDPREGLYPAVLRRLERQIEERIHKAPLRLNEYGYDPFGFEPKQAARLLLGQVLLYRHYFRVATYDIGRVPPGRVLLIANHAGQFAYDGAMLAMAMLFEAEPPRIARGMGEYFLWKVPWMGRTASRMGTLVGTPENCVAMLESEGCVMVFPEGARGANKPFHERYRLKPFGQGFMRLALETNTPIVPVGIVGSEEQQPGFANLEGLGRAVGLPSFPITISQPWFPVVGSLFALPVKYHIHFGEPLRFDGWAHDEDEAIQVHVDVVRDAVARLLEKGRRERKGIFF